MPELPDVEVFKRYADATVLHKTIVSVQVPAPEMLASVSRQAMTGRLHGRRFSGTDRHGKYLFLHTGDTWSLVLHFGMTGTLKYAKSPDADASHVRLTIGFENGYRLDYVCQRKFGAIDLTDSPQDFIRGKALGPDPLADGLSRKDFVNLMAGRRGSLKSALMNQRIMAGLGNVYSDEVLFQAGWHPASAVAELGEAELRGLFDVVQEVIAGAVAARAQPDAMPSDYLTGRREPDRACPRCDGRIRRTTLAGRTAYYCDRHQKKPGSP